MTPLEALKEYKKQNEYGVNVYADEYVEIIEKSLKALETIKKYYEVCECYNHQYIMTDGNGGCVELTKEEYELLKEVLL